MASRVKSKLRTGSKILTTELTGRTEFGKMLKFMVPAALALGLAGCGITLHQYPASADRYDSQAAYPALQPQEVYFFLSKDAFPPDLRFVPVARLWAPWNAEWSYQDLLREFQKKAAEIGANAVVFERVSTSKLDYGYLCYSGQAIAYRLYAQNPPEAADLSSAQYGTQTPDLSLVK